MLRLDGKLGIVTVYQYIEVKVKGNAGALSSPISYFQCVQFPHLNLRLTIRKMHRLHCNQC